MSSISAGKSAVRTRAARSEGWFAALGVKGRRAFRAAYTGYMLDAFDLIVLTLSLSAIGATFGVGTGATGALSTVTLSASAIGGVLAGVLCDRVGRARADRRPACGRAAHDPSPAEVPLGCALPTRGSPHALAGPPRGAGREPVLDH